MSSLDAQVAQYVAKGFAVESRTESQAVLVKRSRIGLFWNVLLTVVTGGLWLIVIAYRLINRKSSRVVLTAREDGRTVRT